MKIHSIAITLLISTAVSSFSPPCFKTWPHHAPLPGQAASSTDATKETELEKQQQHQISGRKWGQKMKYSAKKTRPFANLSFDELKSLTEYHLSHKHLDSLEDNDYGDKETSSRQVHEIKKLISSWSKLASAGYMNSGSSNDIDSNVIMLTKKEKSVAAEMAERCLKTLSDVEKRRMIDGANNSILSMDLYHSVINAWVKSGSHSDLIHATSILDYIEKSDHNNISIKGLTVGPSMDTSESSTKCYVATLDGWCKSPYEDAAIQAERILNRMVSLGIQSVKHYNNVLNRLASSGKSNAGTEAERLLMELIELYKSGNTDMAPDKNSFNTVIRAYANAGGKNGSRNAKRILSMMENPSKFGLQDIASNIEPDRVSCTSIMMAWANANEYGGCDVDAGEKAEQLLMRMEKVYENKGDSDMKPDCATYNAVIKVWGKCGHPEAAIKSEELLDKMLKHYEENKDAAAKPDDVTFNSVIHNIATSADLDSPQRAQKILQKMQYCHEHRLIDFKPDIITYNSVLNSFAKSDRQGSAQKAEDILNDLEKSFDSGAWNVEPDVYSYNTVISAWSNSNEEDSALRAVALLDRMSSRAKKTKSNIKPDSRSYNTVLHAWSRSKDRNAPIKALGLLELMFRLYDNGDENAQPDVLSFSTVINAFSKSKFSWKARECRNLLRRMQTLHDEGQENMKPNIFVYSAVLNACAYTFGRAEEKEEALNVGIETFEELKNSGIRPNHVAYGSFLRICRRLMPDNDSRRNHFITRAFKQCCADGQVGEYVLKQIRADYKLYPALLQAYIVNGEVDHEDLPHEWTRNVRERRRTNQPRAKGVIGR